MKKWNFILALLLIAFIVNCGQANKEESNDKTKKKKKKKTEKKVTSDKKKGKDKKKDEDDTVPVQVISANKGDISSYLLFSSNIDTEKAADIYPMTTGIIEKILFDVGDEVKKGTVLAKLDKREASLNERKSNISFKQLKMEFERKKELFNRSLISKETYEKAKFDLEQADLDWKQKKLMLSYTKITSPISGVVSKRHIKIGNKITTSQLAFSVIYTKEKIAIVNIPEQEKRQIFKKQMVFITAKDIRLEGSIKNISPSIDPESGTFKVTVIVKDIEGLLSVGQFVNIKIVKKVHKDVVLLSKEALVFEGGKVFVYIIEKDMAIKKLVKTGFDDGIKVEITEGVKISDKLVTAGKSSLKEKTKVKIIKSIL